MTDAAEPRILIVDDARDIREPLGQFLRRSGYRTRLAADAAEARQALAEDPVHLAVIDVMMPGEDGLTLTRDLRRKSQTPVLLLTALAGVVDEAVIHKRRAHVDRRDPQVAGFAHRVVEHQDRRLPIAALALIRVQR